MKTTAHLIPVKTKLSEIYVNIEVDLDYWDVYWKEDNFKDAIERDFCSEDVIYYYDHMIVYYFKINDLYSKMKSSPSFNLYYLVELIKVCLSINHFVKCDIEERNQQINCTDSDYTRFDYRQLYEYYASEKIGDILFEIRMKYLCGKQINTYPIQFANNNIFKTFAIEVEKYNNSIKKIEDVYDSIFRTTKCSLNEFVDYVISDSVNYLKGLYVEKLTKTSASINRTISMQSLKGKDLYLSFLREMGKDCVLGEEWQKWNKDKDINIEPEIDDEWLEYILINHYDLNNYIFDVDFDTFFDKYNLLHTAWKIWRNEESEIHKSPHANQINKRSQKQNLFNEILMPYWSKLKEQGFVDDNYKLTDKTTHSLAAYIAQLLGERLGISKPLRTCWKPFYELWGLPSHCLANCKKESTDSGKSPIGHEKIDKIFE